MKIIIFTMKIINQTMKVIEIFRADPPLSNEIINKTVINV